jgi:hypothetical protein
MKVGRNAGWAALVKTEMFYYCGPFLKKKWAIFLSNDAKTYPGTIHVFAFRKP